MEAKLQTSHIGQGFDDGDNQKKTGPSAVKCPTFNLSEVAVAPLRKSTKIPYLPTLQRCPHCNSASCITVV